MTKYYIGEYTFVTIPKFTNNELNKLFESRLDRWMKTQMITLVDLEHSYRFSTYVSMIADSAIELYEEIHNLYPYS